MIKKCKRCKKKLTARQNKFCCVKCVNLFYASKGGKASIASMKKNNSGFFSIKARAKIIKTNRKYKRDMCHNKEIQSKGGKIGGPIGGRIAAITNRKNGTSCFFDKKLQSKAGKIGGQINKKNKTGVCDPKNQSLGGKAGWKKAHLTQKRLKVGWYSKDNNLWRKKAIEKSLRKQKRLKIGFYSVINHPGKIGGKIASENNRINKTGPFFNLKLNRLQRLNAFRNRGTYFFKGLYYDSNAEREFALNIYYQLCKLKLHENYQYECGQKLIDFFIKRYNCFIEYHPYDKNKTAREYFKDRRTLLNNNGYKDYNLLVIS